MGDPVWLQVALEVPLPSLFDYQLAPGQEVAIGQRVRVQFGAKQAIGMVIHKPESPDYDTSKIQTVLQVMDDVPPLDAQWLDLAKFASQYYHRPLGEVVMSALPVMLRKPAMYTSAKAAGGPVARLQARQQKAAQAQKNKCSAAKAAATETSTKAQVGLEIAQTGAEPRPTVSWLDLNTAQQEAISQIQAQSGYQTWLLHGVTGSGKTEVYLHLMRRVIQQQQQVLMLVPEINLTPQFEQQLKQRFADVLPDESAIVVMHSNLSDGERLTNWLAIHTGQAQIVLATRLGIFAPLTNLGLIVVDEEHDGSYKQQEKLRYSARDLAVWRGHQLQIPVVLGSATPSLETWHHVQEGRYRKLSLPARAVKSGYQPQFEIIDCRQRKLIEGLSEPALEQLKTCLDQGHQALVFINRRGYAPVLHCPACAWTSQCQRCSVATVLHKTAQQRRVYNQYVLQCHHCGWQARVPRSCPNCGNQDLRPLGTGTQKIEEFLGQYFPQARIQRIDADNTRRKGSAQRLFQQVHDGEVDILVGTQMVSKGHDFKRLQLVCIVNADNSLYASDFRAPERLFAQLLQVAGRAGRHLPGGKVLLQTEQPDHMLYRTLVQQDFQTFANQSLLDRKIAGLPPYSFQALLTAQAKQLEQAIGFLQQTKALAQSPECRAFAVTLYDPIPLRIMRVQNVERAQLLIEAEQRPHLQGFLNVWLDLVSQAAKQERIKYTIEIDPQEI
ncbi:primosomal protein N' [Brackiella oedipodis]|uniref:primosomal protein N' n=1 Tax=Brackiella oedipodis TaxID=124225 RepID=UPI0006861369|nr:primosomal protein N' [Brackiella oedipodis]